MLQLLSVSVLLISIILIITGEILSIQELYSVADIGINSYLISIFYFCHHSNWKIKKFMSCKIWELISKMGLSIYLMSSYVLFTFYERQVEPLEIENKFAFVSENILNLNLQLLINLTFF